MIKHDDLAAAIEEGDEDKVQQLLSKNPDVVNAPDWTPPPLHCAVLWNKPGVAEVLLDNGADIEIKDPDRKTTPLRYAIVYCQTDMIPLLLARGASVDAIQENGTTALQLAEHAADGAFEDFEDLPPKREYGAVVQLLRELGVH